MADIRIERRRGRSLWPWMIGLVVAALLMWAIAELVNTDRDNSTMAEADSANAPAANQAGPVPSVAGAAAPAAERASNAGITPLGALVPLGVQDVGQTVSASGQVLGKPAGGGFWLRSEGNTFIWVKSAQAVKEGQQLQDLTGTLEKMPESEAAARLKGLGPQAQLKGTGAQLTSDLYLDTGAGAEARARAGRRAAADTAPAASMGGAKRASPRRRTARRA